LPLIVAALVRLPAGVLTDRYGARVVLSAVSARRGNRRYATGAFQ
jgi:nitrate/nitrite transporter NarK